MLFFIRIVSIYIPTKGVGGLPFLHTLIPVFEIGSSVVMWMNLESVTQSEVTQKEEKKSHISTYMWNLEKRYRCLYFQGRHRDADGESGLRRVAVGNGGAVLGSSDWPSVMVGGRGRGLEGGEVGVHTADSLPWRAEAKATLWSNYTPVKTNEQVCGKGMDSCH